MNIYDTRPLVCSRCKESIGEIDYDAIVIRSLCGKCANSIPEGDKILYTVSHFQNSMSSKIKLPPVVI